MNRYLATALGLAMVLPLAAQEPTPAPVRPDDARTTERAQSMREQIDGGRTVRSHVRVLVRLKNGNRLRGVVKDGRFVERVDGLRFVDAQAKERGAGIRLWYTSGARNYVFVPFADFAEYTVLQRLSADELETMEKQLQMEEARKAERLATQARSATGKADGAGTPPAAEAPTPTGDEAATDTPPKPAGDTKPTAGDVVKKTDEETEQQRLWFSLLQSYPPAAGWGKARRDEIAKRKAVIGANPSPVELKFVEQFGEWQKACVHFAVDPEAKPAEGSESAEGGDSSETSKERTRSRRRR